MRSPKFEIQDINDLQFEVKLTNPPTAFESIPQPLEDNMDLSEMQKYTKKSTNKFTKIVQKSTNNRLWRGPEATLGPKRLTNSRLWRGPGVTLGPNRPKNTVCLGTGRLTHFSRRRRARPRARFGHHFGSFFVMILMIFGCCFYNMFWLAFPLHF